MTPRLILDTNVFVAAGFRPGSASARLVEALRGGRLVLVWNEATRAEARAVLRRIPQLDFARVEGFFSGAGHVDAPIDPAAFPAVPDPADRVFAALAAVADVPVVSSDHDLLAGRPHPEFEVLTPSEALHGLNR